LGPLKAVLAFRKKIGSVDEFRDAGHRGADPWLAADRRKLGGVEGRELGQRRRRIGLAVEILHMIRKVAQLTRFIDQAGLFLANRPVANKLHFSLLPDVVFVASMLHGTARGEIQLPTAQRIAGLLNDELESVAIAPDVPGAEMPADH
jgi:hypothetical protein